MAELTGEVIVAGGTEPITSANGALTMGRGPGTKACVPAALVAMRLGAGDLPWDGRAVSGSGCSSSTAPLPV